MASLGEEYDPCKVYTLFYEVSFVPNKFRKRADDKSVREDLHKNIDSESAENTLCVDTTKVLASNVDFRNNANDQKARLQTASFSDETFSEAHNFWKSKLRLIRKFREIAQNNLIDAKWENKSLTRQFLLALNDKFCLASDSLPIPLQKVLGSGYQNGAFLLPYPLRRIIFGYSFG